MYYEITGNDIFIHIRTADIHTFRTRVGDRGEEGGEKRVPLEADGNKNFHRESYRINEYERKNSGEMNAVRFYLFITIQLVAGGFFR